MSNNLANTLQFTVAAIVFTFSFCFIVFHVQNCLVSKGERGCVSKAYDIEQYRKNYYTLECKHSQQKIISKEINGVKYLVCECQDMKGDAGVQEKQDEQVP